MATDFGNELVHGALVCKSACYDADCGNKLLVWTVDKGALGTTVWCSVDIYYIMPKPVPAARFEKVNPECDSLFHQMDFPHTDACAKSYVKSAKNQQWVTQFDDCKAGSA
eukprot:TRINITY_DN10060_c0_g1_i1.p1 TRINITY_DN10060_c0_g1~~TRINITY_DN10060_c0_g1_i1.p1  ORF type:complete len:110 (-),score=7.85 TRINITY_DN10060_c0_g1_i1:312-641(-)